MQWIENGRLHLQDEAVHGPVTGAIPLLVAWKPYKQIKWSIFKKTFERFLTATETADANDKIKQHCY